LGKSYILPSVVGAGVLMAALIIAGILALVLRGNNASSEVATESADGAFSGMVENPMFQAASQPRNNPLFQEQN